MSKKINVNPDHYKLAGRERPGKDVPHELQRQAFAMQLAETERWQAKRPELPPVSEPAGVPAKRTKAAGKVAASRRPRTARGKSTLPKAAARKKPVRAGAGKRAASGPKRSNSASRPRKPPARKADSKRPTAKRAKTHARRSLSQRRPARQ